MYDCDDWSAWSIIGSDIWIFMTIRICVFFNPAGNNINLKVCFFGSVAECDLQVNTSEC